MNNFRLYIQQVHIGDFVRLSDLYDYVYHKVSSISNNHSFDSYNVFELERTKKGFIFKKDFIHEKQLDWNTINYLLDNHIVK